MSPFVVAVVLPCHDGRPFLAEQLEALRRQRFDRPWELVLVDNASTDGSAALFVAADHHPLCAPRVVSEPVLGLNRARNAGIRSTSAPLVALCDADDVADPGWLAGVVAALEGGSHLVGGVLELSTLNSSRARRMNGLSGRPVGTWEVAPGVWAAAGASCAFTRALWARVGGFDERYVSGGDDTEFGIRCSLAGAPAERAEGAVMHYRLRTERRAVFRRAVRDEKARARIRAEHPDLGIERRSSSAALRSLVYCAREFALWPFRRHEHRDRAVRTAGSCVGRIIGSVRYRTYFP